MVGVGLDSRMGVVDVRSFRSDASLANFIQVVVLEGPTSICLGSVYIYAGSMSRS